MSGGSAKDVLAMSYLIDGDAAGLIVDCVDDPIVALSNSVTIVVAGQLLRTVRTRIVSEAANPADDSEAVRL